MAATARLIVTEHCVGLGVCAATAPSLFELRDGRSRARVAELRSAEDIELARDAAGSCPMTAIDVSDG